MASVETPSGKGAGDENFPVGSWLLPRRLRPHVAAYYAFARAADDIADNGALDPAEKVARLDRFKAAVTGAAPDDPELAKAHRLRRSLQETGVPVRHAVDLLHAFKMDATKLRYRDWDDLMGYCELSANPVGRFLLDLHGEDRAIYPASDALCSALQVLNHMQDLQADYRRLDRVYLPLGWLEAEGLDVSVLDGPRTEAPLRRAIDRCLDNTAALLADARPLMAQLRSRHLALESGAIHRLAVALEARLRSQDPLAGRVEVGGPAFLGHAARGALGTLLRRLLRTRPGAPAATGRVDRPEAGE